MSPGDRQQRGCRRLFPVLSVTGIKVFGRRRGARGEEGDLFSKRAPPPLAHPDLQTGVDEGQQLGGLCFQQFPVGAAFHVEAQQGLGVGHAQVEAPVTELQIDAVDGVLISPLQGQASMRSRTSSARGLPWRCMAAMTSSQGSMPESQ